MEWNGLARTSCLWVWRQQGALGLVRLFSDIALRLPVEYVASWCNTIKEVTMDGDLSRADQH